MNQQKMIVLTPFTEPSLLDETWLSFSKMLQKGEFSFCEKEKINNFIDYSKIEQANIISDDLSSILSTKGQKFLASSIYLTSKSPIDIFSELQKDQNLGHIIDLQKKETLEQELSYALKKIQSPGLSSLSSYLKPGHILICDLIRNKAEKTTALEKLNFYLSKKKFSTTVRKQSEAIANELMMNALFDGAKYSNKPAYQNQDFKNIELSPEDEISLNYAFDDEHLAICVKDSFGSLTEKTFFAYLKKVLIREDPNLLMDTKKEGAGLGLFKVLYFSHSLSCTIQPGKKTEIMAVIHKNMPLIDFKRAPRSIHFFTHEGT